MDFTFGIITNPTGDAPHYAQQAILSIYRQSVPIENCEIIVVGGEYDGLMKVMTNYSSHVGTLRHVSFDESVKEGWITRKKNIITERAKYDNIVYMHDYVMLSDTWHEEFIKFGEDWDICMTSIINSNFKRYRDWTTYDHPNIDPKNRQVVHHKVSWIQYEPWCPNGLKVDGGGTLMPYDYDGGHMYISGAYWVAKKHVMEAEPLNEDLKHSEAEDVEWSLRVRDKYKYVMNEMSKVHLLRYKPLDDSWFRLLNFLKDNNDQANNF
jgi:hypothetical protein